MGIPNRKQAEPAMNLPREEAFSTKCRDNRNQAQRRGEVMGRGEGWGEHRRTGEPLPIIVPIFTKHLLSDRPEKEDIEGWIDSGKRKVGRGE